MTPELIAGEVAKAATGRMAELTRSATAPQTFLPLASAQCAAWMLQRSEGGLIAWWTDDEVGTRWSRNESPALGVQTE